MRGVHWGLSAWGLSSLSTGRQVQLLILILVSTVSFDDSAIMQS